MKELRDERRSYSVSGLCNVFGHTRQAYYQHEDNMLSSLAEESFVVEYVKSVRRHDPGIGGRKLWHMYCREFGVKSAMGHCRFESIVSKYGLCIRTGSRRPRTTDSRHSLPTYPNRIKELIPMAANEVWVSDITYQKIWDDVQQGTCHFCYISIITDYYTKEIIGYSVGETLSAEYPIKALDMALERIEGQERHTIHHSDRGVQYASSEYIRKLREHGIVPSMTECGNPKDNAVAERVNNTLKNELFKGMWFFSLKDVREALDKAVFFYNNRRPHCSIAMMTPAEAARKSGELKKNWTSYRENRIKALSGQ